MIGALSQPAILVLALILDALIGDPRPIWDKIPHPVALAGRYIGFQDRVLNGADLTAAQRRRRGVVLVIQLVVLAAILGWLVQTLLIALPAGSTVVALLASILIAQRSLYEHVNAVAAGLRDGGIDGGRAAVAHIVGRDPDRLDEPGIARAAIESTAENFSDGVVAPAFWFVLFGLPGLLVYKAINTADSMIGYKTERHQHFGWAAARFDDLLSWLPARLSGLLIACAAPLAGGRIRHALAIMVRDAPIHRSPNAGWPEAAMAGAVQVALAGPRIYADGVADDPYLNAGGRLAIGADEISAALRVLAGACFLHGFLYALIALVF